MTSIDAVIVTYSSRSLVPDCIRAVHDLDAVGSLVVVDNGTDGAGEIAAALGADVVRRPDNPGFGTSQNEGSKRGRAELLLLLNPDARILPAAIEAGRDYLLGHRDVAAVQGAILNDRGANERSSGLALRPVHLVGRALGLRHLKRIGFVRWLASQTRIGNDHLGRPAPAPLEVEWLAATALLVRRSAFEGVGGFDERFFLYAEDDDLCRRFRSEGWRLVHLPVDWATHAGGASSAGSWEREVSYWNGAMTLAAIWYRPLEWFVATAAALLRVSTLCLFRPRRTAWIVNRLLRSPMQVRRDHRRHGRVPA
jgi:GT2 family glycosyltransferase